MQDLKSRSSTKRVTNSISINTFNLKKNIEMLSLWIIYLKGSNAKLIFKNGSTGSDIMTPTTLVTDLFLA